MLAQFTAWLLSLITGLFAAVADFAVDVAVNLLDLLLTALVTLLGAIPAPEFLSSGLQSIYSQLDGGVLYFLNAVGLPTGLGFVSVAVAFRLVRKAATLFQW